MFSVAREDYQQATKSIGPEAYLLSALERLKSFLASKTKTHIVARAKTDKFLGTMRARKNKTIEKYSGNEAFFTIRQIKQC